MNNRPDWIEDGGEPLGWTIAGCVVCVVILVACMVVDCNVSGTTWGL